jgi:hypothetical protein
MIIRGQRLVYAHIIAYKDFYSSNEYLTISLMFIAMKILKYSWNSCVTVSYLKSYTIRLTHSTDNSVYWEATSRLPSQEITCILLGSKDQLQILLVIHRPHPDPT